LFKQAKEIENCYAMMFTCVLTEDSRQSCVHHLGLTM